MIRWSIVRSCASAFLAAWFIAPSVAAQDPERIGPEARFEAVARQLSAFIERERIDKGIDAISIALVADQRIVWSQGFGMADAARGTPATARTIYRVGSVSKLFTDIAVMQLVERGDLDLDAPIQRYLPSFTPRNPFGRAITLRQLMSHHSGLVREPPVGNYFDDSGTSLDAMVRSLSSTALVYPPATHGKYSNAAIGTVGWLLQERLGAPFADLLQRRVLDSLGMAQSSFDPRADLMQRLARATMWNLHGRNFPAPNFQLGMSPAGSMYATMPDLGRFMAALFAQGQGSRGRILSRESLEAMWQPQFAPAGARNGLGIGFMVGQAHGERVVSHGGAIYGFATQLSAAPDRKLGVAVSASKDGVNALTERIADEALRLMLDAERGQGGEAPRTTAPVSLAIAKRMQGEWRSGTTSLAVVARDSTVWIDASGVPRAGLRVWSGDTLITDDGMSFGGKVWMRGERLMHAGRSWLRVPPRRTLPAEPPARWRGLIGEYGWDHNVLYVLEKQGRLTALIEWFFEYPLRQIAPDVYAFPNSGLYDGERLVFRRDAAGRATEVEAAGVVFKRRTWVGEDGGIFRITPVRPVEELRRAALAASPPAEEGTFRASELTELVRLDSTIRLDVRYASDRNFLSVPLYTQARAFLQRPAAEALVRANRALRRQGYGLLIHDGYRPWYVTKMFWDGTPEDKHQFVADPSRGSRHNRGCAVDLTLFDLRTGQPVIMPGGYDEMSDRSYPEYPGGTSRQRALREILRSAMEAEGFAVYEAEWWHFDYKDWRLYRIGNERFEEFR